MKTEVFMKYVFLTVLTLMASVGFAVERETVTNDEIQKELDSAGDKIIFDEEDRDFLNSRDQAAEKVEKKDGVVWGKALGPVKKAEAPVKKPVQQ
jgi:hypothetical protein